MVVGSFDFSKGGIYGMRTLIYLIVILNSVIGLYILFREKNPFKGKTYREIAESRRKKV